MDLGTLAGRRVLIVEDEMLIALLLEDMLIDIGVSVVGIAGRLGEALKLLETCEIDAAILDVNLDGESSYGLAGALAEAGIPFMFSTGYGDVKPPAEFGDPPILVKPFQSHDLERSLLALAWR